MRKGIEDYDKRRGYRGPITNKIKNKKLEKKIKRFQLDPTLKWMSVEITFLNNEIKFKSINKR